MASVTLNKLVKRFGKVTAVNGVDLEIRDGEFLILLGSSGCGKSTLLYCVAGLETISSGEIRIGGQLMNRVPPKARNIAMVFQDYALYPHMNVYDNMAFGLKLRKTDRAEIDRRVQDAAGLLDIGHLLARRPRELSGGQRQRVALGRAIVREPRVFLMDEPLSNLDAILRVQMRSELSRLHRRLRTTVIYVTHDQTEAMTMGDRVVVMRDGSIQQVGTPLEVYYHPATMFVASFIGTPSMNFLRGVLRENGQEGLGVDTGNFLVPLSRQSWKAAGPWVGKVVTAGVRPAGIATAQADEAAEGPVLSGIVDGIEPMGDTAYALVRAGETLLTVRVDPLALPAQGQVVALRFNPRDVHLFDPETQAVIASASAGDPALPPLALSRP